MEVSARFSLAKQVEVEERREDMFVTSCQALLYATPVNDVDILRNCIVECCEIIRNFPGIHQYIRVSMQWRRRHLNGVNREGNRSCRDGLDVLTRVAGYTSVTAPCEDTGGAVARALDSHHGDLGSIPGFSHVGIVLDDSACRRVFSGYSRFTHPCIPVPIHTRVSLHAMPGDDGHLRFPAGKSVRLLSPLHTGASAEFFGYCPTSGNHRIRKMLLCKYAIGSETCRACLINCDPIAKSYDGITARLARRSDEALGVHVAVARIAPSLLELQRAAT
ncbi:hypothetical protein PR048_026989 [Dryococelus australis]|uniref:Uncharacterized protein n=1 Tax=Dryococelus australis TaxID=614101 RepID=A0ABQ9GMW6_9NEOP|nr:hypothetical protein PR048_026989 [Dryococelus australis]